MASILRTGLEKIREAVDDTGVIQSTPVGIAHLGKDQYD